MTISVTGIKLKSVWHFFELSWLGLKVVLQMRKQKGFIKTKSTGFGYWHFTLSAWETPEDLKNFATKGAHLQAMKHSKRIAHEVVVYTFKSDELPTWSIAKLILFEKGRRNFF